MIIKDIISEDFINYKVSTMTILCPYCNFKCDHECGKPVCQNSELAETPNIEINDFDLALKYINNPITRAICFQGLEPFDSFEEMLNFIMIIRNNFKCNDDIVIYTGYNKDEIQSKLDVIKRCEFENIIIKYGRFIPGHEPHYDGLLGINLASDNQYAERL